MKILLVDDDTSLAEVTAFALRRAGFLVLVAHDAEQAERLLAAEQPNLMLLDIQMPGKDGLTLCREVRASNTIPIIMLTVRGSDDDIVLGLENGADDYIPKPFSPKQLIARVQAVLRRSAALPKQARLVVGDCTLDTAQHMLQTSNGTVRLTRLEFRLFHYLLINRGQTVPTEAILTHVWGYADSTDRALLKQLVYRLRQKVEALDPHAMVIETVPSVGYTIPKAQNANR